MKAHTFIEKLQEKGITVQERVPIVSEGIHYYPLLLIWKDKSIRLILTEVHLGGIVIYVESTQKDYPDDIEYIKSLLEE